MKNDSKLLAFLLLVLFNLMLLAETTMHAFGQHFERHVNIVA